MRMQTGMAEVEDKTINQVALQKLLVCFVAVYERQILCRAFVYMFHNNEEENIDGQFHTAIHRALKYSTLSPNGVAARLRPYILYAYQQGLLTEEDCDDDPIVLKALSLYPLVHQAWEQGGEEGAKKWCLDYVFKMLAESEAVTEEALLAGDMDPPDDLVDEGTDDSKDAQLNEDVHQEGEGADDAIEIEEDDDDNNDEMDVDGIACTCDICEEMRGYDDLDLDSIPVGQGIDAIIINGMKQALKL